MTILRRKLLASTTLLMAVAGIAIASVPFGLSLFPGAREDAALPRVDVSTLTPGSFRLATPENAFELFNDFKHSVYIIKTGTGEIRAWDVYAKNGEVGMPDYHWWRVYFTCKDFRPSLINGVVSENSLIQCHDEDLSPWQSENWKWTLDGKAITQNVSDMQPARGLVEGDYFVIGKMR